MLHKALAICMVMIVSLKASAQSILEETFYQSGKINVVIAVILIILSGLLWYVFRLNKKIDDLNK